MSNTIPPPPSISSAPPGAWRPAMAVARRLAAPVERFLQIEAASGILLVAVAAVALIWANSPWADSYAALWHADLGGQLGPWSFTRPLHFWINDGLMALFFFVVGLEIRREIARGELSELRRAALPVAAAVGGMMVPALIFLAFNHGRPSLVGWGVPMATDIAFAVGVLVLLGPRVPPALRILLLALAVIDDLGAILVIAIFYTSELWVPGVAVAGAGLAGILVLQRIGVRSPWAYVPPAVVAWAGTYTFGVHPTLAGVAVGLLTPVRVWFGPLAFADQAETATAQVRAARSDDEVLPALDAIAAAGREAVAPVDRLIHALHGWVAFIIMPVFALANAGVPLGGASLDGDAGRVFWGVALGLAVGKPVGVLLLAWALRASGLGALPTGVGWGATSVVGVVAGIGFTMALFIAGLAFATQPQLLETAKLAILCGSAAAALLGYALGRVMLPAHLPAGAARTASEAERSTEA